MLGRVSARHIGKSEPCEPVLGEMSVIYIFGKALWRHPLSLVVMDAKHHGGTVKYLAVLVELQ